jgi:hypothetical protein
MSGAGRNVIHHAVPADSTDGLYGEPSRPLPILGWSMPFALTAPRACPECVHELRPASLEVERRLQLPSGPDLKE